MLRFFAIIDFRIEKKYLYSIKSNPINSNQMKII
jgi:hypothetical protein